MKLKYLILALTVIMVSCKCKKNKKACCENHKKEQQAGNYNLPFSYMAENLEWTGATISDENYTIWGSSPIMGEDEKVHVFSARWPELNVDPGWRRSCEVAHYVADQPEGPYVFVDVAVKGTGKDGDWNKFAPHNPEIKKIGDYYAIVFIANDNPEKGFHPGNQKIGLVYSKSLYGPWEKAGKNGLILEASQDPNHWTHGSGLGVDNPCLTEIDGKPVVYFKAKTEEIKGSTGKAKYSYAIAESIEGPYKMSDETITDNDSYLEDATCFSSNGKHYLLTTDNHGHMSGLKGGAVLWESETGFKYSLSKAEIAYKLIPDYWKSFDKNKVNKVYGAQAKFERPKVLMKDGKPAYLFAPSGWNVNGDKRVVCYVLKIK